MKHLDLIILGNVQGVNFRWETAKRADKLSIKGSVKNLPDGSVRIEAEGDESNMDKFVKWCEQGPWFSEVDDIKIETGELKNYKTFEIKY